VRILGSASLRVLATLLGSNSRLFVALAKVTETFFTAIEASCTVRTFFAKVPKATVCPSFVEVTTTRVTAMAAPMSEVAEVVAEPTS